MAFMFSLNPKTVNLRICGEILKWNNKDVFIIVLEYHKEKKNTSAVTYIALYVMNDHNVQEVYNE